MKITLLSALILASTSTLASDFKHTDPKQYSTPAFIFKYAEDMLLADDTTHAKVAYSDALFALRKVSDAKHSSVIKHAKTLLSNVYNLKEGMTLANPSLLQLCHLMTNSSVPDFASAEQVSFRSAVYNSCLPLYETVFGSPTIDPQDLLFDTQGKTVLVFNADSSQLIVGIDKLFQTTVLELSIAKQLLPDKIVFESDFIDQGMWNKVHQIYPGIDEVSFVSSSNASVRIFTGLQTEVIALDQFMNLQVEAPKYELSY
jgi:hypothetical protein